MPVTLSHIITEMNKLRQQAEKKYSQYVQQGSMTHYTKEHKLAVLDEILKAAQKAYQSKITLTEQLNTLPK